MTAAPIPAPSLIGLASTGAMGGGFDEVREALATFAAPYRMDRDRVASWITRKPLGGTKF